MSPAVPRALLPAGLSHPRQAPSLFCTVDQLLRVWKQLSLPAHVHTHPTAPGGTN